MITPFETNHDHDEMREVVRSFCAEQVAEREVRRIMESESGHDPELWRRLGSELGALGLMVPEEYGGSGQSLQAQAVVVEEFGAALMTGPVIGTLALAIPALCAVSSVEAKASILPKLVAGEHCAAFVVPDHRGRYDADKVEITARQEGNGWVLDGALGHVVDAPAADMLIVAARGPDGVALFSVERGAAGLTTEPISVMDQTRRRAIVRFEGCFAQPLAGPEETPAVCARAFQIAGALLSSEQAGGAGRVLDNTIEYIGNRIQFGRPIGSFQAIKHRCADLLVSVEHARSVARAAAWSIDRGADDADVSVAVASSICSEAYYQVAAASIQLHGGIGFTWEHSAHLYFKRAVTDASLLGSAEEQRQVIAEKVFETPVEQHHE